MNKGIAAAHGDYLLFLNSGDYFYREDVIEKVLDRIEQGDNKDFYCGNVKFEEKEKFQYAPKNVTAFYLVGNSIPHQACFIRRSLLVKRPYLETYRIVSDWEQMLYACLYEHASFEYMDIVVSVFNLGGISNNKKMQRVRGEEMADVVNKLIPSLVEAFQRPLTPADWKYYHAMHYGSRTKRNWKIMRNAFKDLIRHWTGR